MEPMKTGDDQEKGSIDMGHHFHWCRRHRKKSLLTLASQSMMHACPPHYGQVIECMVLPRYMHKSVTSNPVTLVSLRVRTENRPNPILTLSK